MFSAEQLFEDFEWPIEQIRTDVLNAAFEQIESVLGPIEQTTNSEVHAEVITEQPVAEEQPISQPHSVSPEAQRVIDARNAINASVPTATISFTDLLIDAQEPKREDFDRAA